MASFCVRKVCDTIAAELGQFGLRQIDTLTFGVEKTSGLVSGLWIQSRNIMEAKRLSDFGSFGIWVEFERLWAFGARQRYRLGRSFTATKQSQLTMEPFYVYEETLAEDCAEYIGRMSPFLAEGVAKYSSVSAFETFILDGGSLAEKQADRCILLELLLRGVDDAEAEYSTFFAKLSV